MKPSLSSVHTTQALGNVAINYSNADFKLAGMVAPIITVQKESDKYYIFYVGDRMRDEAAVDRRPGTRAPRGGFHVTTATYTTKEVAYAEVLPWRVRDNMDTVLRAFVNRTEAAMEKVRLSQEKAIATTLADSGAAIWTSTSAVAAGSEWDSAGGGDAIGEFKTARSTVRGLIGREPNTAVISWEVAEALFENDQILDKMNKVGSPKDPVVATPESLARVLRIPNLIIVSAMYDTYLEAATPSSSLSTVLGDTSWVGYVNPRPDILNPSALYTFRKGSPAVRTYEEQAEKQTVFEAEELVDHKATLADAGYTITNCLE